MARIPSNPNRQGETKRPGISRPLRFDWQRIRTVIDNDAGDWVEPFMFYRARVNESTLLNAMRVRATWHWALIHHSTEQTIVDGGTAGTMREAKWYAEQAARPFENRQPQLWESNDDERINDEELPF